MLDITILSYGNHRFRYRDRGSDRTVVFIPGWGLDWRLFLSFELSMNVLYLEHLLPTGFESDLNECLDDLGVKDPIIIGFSLGGLLAASFAVRYSNYKTHLILMGVRECYPMADIERVRGYLKRKKERYMRQFYTRCILCDAQLRVFNAELYPLYLRQFSMSYLLDTLTYFTHYQLPFEALSDVYRVDFVHGEQDEIAPYAELALILRSFPAFSCLTLVNQGHIFLLDKKIQRDILSLV